MYTVNHKKTWHFIFDYNLPGLRLELNLEPTAHSARHALLHVAPKWSSHRTTRPCLIYNKNKNNYSFYSRQFRYFLMQISDIYHYTIHCIPARQNNSLLTFITIITPPLICTVTVSGVTIITVSTLSNSVMVVVTISVTKVLSSYRWFV